jgi:hypothetical protein
MGVVKRGTGTEFRVVEIAGEDDYNFKSCDLGVLRADVALDISGSSFTIWTLDGSCSIKINLNTKPAIPLTAITYPAMILFDITFTNIYLTNAAQAGKTLKIYIGKK